MSSTDIKLLDGINNSKDLKTLRKRDLPILCQEIRDFLIETVSKTSGHFASNLGVVELTVALHYVFDTPDDVLIWDVGHQSYAHKILTGSKDRLSTIRKKDGLHAFIKRNETPYDHLSTGHASTSLGSALGFAVSNKNFNKDNKVVAIIGDGALSGGPAFEALNNASSIEDINMLVILNDNEMSISENVGSLSQSLSQLLSSPHYTKLIEGGKKVLEKVPAFLDFALRAQEHAKGMIMPGTLFEEFGFNYIGPVDGHDLRRLIPILQNLKELKGLQFLHVVTKKGKGYEKAENDPIAYHGVPVFDPSLGIVSKKDKKDKTFSATFGKWICDTAKKDDSLIGITPAMKIGSCMQDFANNYPKQFFDVAIAEAHSIIFGSGLAASGSYPVVAIYSTFLQRAYDSVIHDMALQNLPMLLAIDRAGLVGPDGATHQGVFDIAFLKTIPNLTIMTPSNLRELYLMLNTSYKLKTPCAVRYARDNGALDFDDLSIDDTLELYKANVVNRAITKDKDSMYKCCILAFGIFANTLYDMCKENDITLVDMRFIKPFDKDIVKEMASTHKHIITIEDGQIEGGIGQSISSYIMSIIHDINNVPYVYNKGISDKFIEEGLRSELLESEGLCSSAILDFINTL